MIVLLLCSCSARDKRDMSNGMAGLAGVLVGKYIAAKYPDLALSPEEQTLRIQQQQLEAMKERNRILKNNQPYTVYPTVQPIQRQPLYRSSPSTYTRIVPDPIKPVQFVPVEPFRFRGPEPFKLKSPLR